MKLLHLGSGSSFDSSDTIPQPQQYSPDPTNYTIKKHLQIDNFLIVFIKYHDCINYEGDKILVFKDININILRSQKAIDPHFSDNKLYYSPIARFIPIEEGAEMAVTLCNLLTNKT